MRNLLVALLLPACTDTTTPKEPVEDQYTPRLILNEDEPDLSPDARVVPIWDAQVDAEPEDAEPDAGCFFGTTRECSLAPILVGECSKGSQSCSQLGWSQCSPALGPRVEVCDGLDNDCDGSTDENPARPGEVLTRSCYDQDLRLTKTGVCSPGVRRCEEISPGEFGYSEECLGQTLPSPEICDGFDNDCNGVVDDLASRGNQCQSAEDVPLVGACRPGVLACVPDEIELVCVEEVLPERELCDEIDNDCDGSVDENLGLCNCENPLFVPRPEICNGIDDDCDGIVDNEGNGLNVRLSTMCFTNEEGVLVPVENAEDFPPMSPPCVGGRALCEQNNEGVSGYFHCAGEVRPGRERCNDLDDDCDGNADEGFEEGTAIVVFGIDISGSMEDHEIETAVEVTDRALMRLAANQDICYIITGIGHEEEPILVPPSNGGVPADGNNGINAREALRNVTQRNWPQGAMDEGTWDLIYDVSIDDRDIDNDFRPENVQWHTDPSDLSVGVDIDFSNVTHRIVVIIGDEDGQTNRGLTQEQVAEQVHASGTLVYVIAPHATVRTAVTNILPSYEQLLPQSNGQCATSPGRDYCDYFYPMERNRGRRQEQIREIEAAL